MHERTHSFGFWLRRRRKALDLTQKALADASSCSEDAIRKIEADERRPSRRLAERLAERLAIPAGERTAFLEAARAVRGVDQLPMELGTDTHSAAEPTAIVELPPQRLILALLLVDLREPFEQPLQLVRIERLGEVVLGAGLDRLDRGVHRSLRGQENDLDVRNVGLQRLQQLNAAHARHHQIGDDNRRPERRNLLERLSAVGGGFGGETPGTHELGQPAPGRGVILDNQDTFGRMGLAQLF